MEFFQFFNEDIEINNVAQIKLVDGALQGQQRLYRRLLTATGNYIWHPSYGAGLPQYIGQNLTPAIQKQIAGKIKTQMFLESTVERSPAPIINITQDGNNLNVDISYVYAPSKQVYTLSFTIGN